MTAVQIADDAQRCNDWWTGYQLARGGSPVSHPDVPTSPDGRGGWAQGKIDHDDMADDRKRVRVVMHDEFTARAKRYAGQLRREQEDRDRRAAAEAKDAREQFDKAAAEGRSHPLAVVCPTCQSGAADSCRNHHNARTAPHAARVKLAADLTEKATAEARAEEIDPRLAKLNQLDAV